MTKQYLLLDCNYLGYRAYHAMGALAHGSIPTGVAFGFMRDLKTLQDNFPKAQPIFCFDHGANLRKITNNLYKANRKAKTKEEEQLKKTVRVQMKLLRTEWLPALGYRNIVAKSGYEADDCIAALCDYLEGEKIIVSADHDLYQLLNSSTSMWIPRNSMAYTLEDFQQEFGVEPSMWVDVKAMAGCSSDNIEGIQGIGEKTACQFLAGRLKPNSAKYGLIIHNNKRWRRNIPLVKLPFADFPSHELKVRSDRTTPDKWRELANQLGMKSLLNSMPKTLIRSKGRK